MNFLRSKGPFPSSVVAVCCWCPVRPSAYSEPLRVYRRSHTLCSTVLGPQRTGLRSRGSSVVGVQWGERCDGPDGSYGSYPAPGTVQHWEHLPGWSAALQDRDHPKDRICTQTEGMICLLLFFFFFFFLLSCYRRRLLAELCCSLALVIVLSTITAFFRFHAIYRRCRHFVFRAPYPYLLARVMPTKTVAAVSLAPNSVTGRPGRHLRRFFATTTLPSNFSTTLAARWQESSGDCDAAAAPALMTIIIKRNRFLSAAVESAAHPAVPALLVVKLVGF